MPPLPDLNNLAALSDEELLQLEGDERHNLEARIHCLRIINTLFNIAFVHIQQYMNKTMASRTRGFFIFYSFSLSLIFLLFFYLSHLDNINRNRTVKVENDLKYLNKQPTEAAASNNNNEPEDNFSSIDNSENDVIRQRRLNRYQSLNSTSDKKNTILSKNTLFN